MASRQDILADQREKLEQWAEKSVSFAPGDVVLFMIVGTGNGPKVSVAEFPAEADEPPAEDFPPDLFQKISMLPFGKIGRNTIMFFWTNGSKPQKGKVILRVSGSVSMESVLRSVNKPLRDHAWDLRLRRVKGEERKSEVEAHYQFS